MDASRAAQTAVHWVDLTVPLWVVHWVAKLAEKKGQEWVR